MHITHWLILCSVIISIAGSAAYIRDTVKGQSKPNRVSWGLWALTPLIGTVAALSIGADVWATVRVFIAGFLPLLVFVASFINPQSYWKLTFFDFLCCTCAVFSLVVWVFVDSPRSAIVFAAIGDGFASLPTIRKAWKFPGTETRITYIASLVSTLLVLPSIPEWNIENSAFQIQLLIANILLVFSVYKERLLFRWC